MLRKVTKKEMATTPHILETVAKTNNQQSKTYISPVFVSRAKLQIGTLLLALQAPLSQNQRKEYWVEFESMLRRYLDLKFCGGVL